MEVGFVNFVVIAHYAKNLEFYNPWVGHLTVKNSWELSFREIKDENDPIFKEFGAGYKSEFIAINGKAITYNMERILNMVRNMDRVNGHLRD